MDDLTIQESDLGTNNSTDHPLVQRITPALLSSICFVSFLVSLPGVIIGVHEYCMRNRVSNFRTERVFLYFTLGISFLSFVGSFQWLGAWLHSTVFSLCSAIGYLSFAAFVFDLMITLCIAIHFILQMYPPKMLVVVHEDKVHRYRKLEMLYLLTSLLVTLCISPLPFIGSNFQFNDWICWVTLDHGSGKSGTTAIASYVFIAFYIFATLIFLFAACVAFMVKILLCIHKRSVDNFYIWVFSLYLLCSLINIILTSTVFYLSKKSTESQTPHNDVKAMSLISIGISPLMASISTSIAITYKRVIRTRRSRHAVLTTPTHYYKSTERVSSINEKLTQNASQSNQTYWVSPATHSSLSSNLY